MALKYFFEKMWFYMKYIHVVKNRRWRILMSMDCTFVWIKRWNHKSNLPIFWIKFHLCIIVIKMSWWWNSYEKKVLNGDGHKFLQYQQNEQSPLIFTEHSNYCYYTHYYTFMLEFLLIHSWKNYWQFWIIYYWCVSKYLLYTLN